MKRTPPLPVAPLASRPQPSGVLESLVRHAAPRPEGTDAWRVVDDEARGLTVDRYGDVLVLSLLADVGAGSATEVAAAVAAGRQTGAKLAARFAARAVYLKLRPRQANTVVDATLAGLAPQAPVIGQPVPGLVITEHGVRIGIDPGSGLGTGLYLDQRDNRRWVGQHAAGKRVLNTFCYTAAFSVAAAVGGAARTVSIDAAQPALLRARENFRLNGMDDTERHDLIRGDVLPWLSKLAKRGDQFDLIILDPPSYAQVDGKRWQAAHDYPDLLRRALALLAPGGRVLACINHAGIDAGKFRRLLEAGVELAGGTRPGLSAQFTLRAPQVDFPSARMKSFLITLR